MNEIAPIAFERPVRIRFAHCDPAGIVFFPQYLTLTNALVEDWFTDALGIDYAAMIGQRRIGLPIVRLECEFARPSRMGETISLSLSLTRVGQRSISIGIAGRGGDGLRFVANQVLVTTSLDTGESISIPNDIRAALARAAASSSTTAVEGPSL
ncbi:acyl-CoA thioesterase [Trinickia soli]|jgi:4-hydroxybenzoyl-CoA thioesterase|uniref:Acyl-CoA thioesterase n=1 Tax=Trinickia soli TaxID=380675 RepID=A0A2N7W1Q7_9BURK|nr:thioesterase family protein [Trinickia soli]PMS23349.1 acyl-CoA thioesterase [Trinickia soli]CAB3709990.1 1,4-dihydroxy-2-naphthoyl-CoA hydrolase [Trinickia soli]